MQCMLAVTRHRLHLTASAIFRGQGTRHASFHLQRDSLQRYKSLDRKSVSFRHPSFRMSAGHRRSFDESGGQGTHRVSDSQGVSEQGLWTLHASVRGRWARAGRYSLPRRPECS